jgi:hypothetical protein
MKNFIRLSAVFLISVFCMSVILLQSCKKKADPTPTPTPTQTPTNYLCDGTGQASYMPMKKGNKWTFNSDFAQDHSEEITDTATINDTLYFEFKYTWQGTGSNDVYFRSDASGNIYKYHFSDGRSYLYLPANPTVGQVIATFKSGEYFKVKSLNSTFSSPSCSYSGLLEIEDIWTGSPTEHFYYKKGLGEVGHLGSFGETDKLEEVIFK